jgi:hypothetical protein
VTSATTLWKVASIEQLSSFSSRALPLAEVVSLLADECVDLKLVESHRPFLSDLPWSVIEIGGQERLGFYMPEGNNAGLSFTTAGLQQLSEQLGDVCSVVEGFGLVEPCSYAQYQVFVAGKALQVELSIAGRAPIKRGGLLAVQEQGCLTRLKVDLVISVDLTDSANFVDMAPDSSACLGERLASLSLRMTGLCYRISYCAIRRTIFGDGVMEAERLTLTRADDLERAWAAKGETEIPLRLELGSFALSLGELLQFQNGTAVSLELPEELVSHIYLATTCVGRVKVLIREGVLKLEVLELF